MNHQENEKRTDRGVVFQVLAWFLFIAAVVIVCAGVGTKYVLTRKLAWDDRIMLLAQATFLAQCISISFAASYGLGKSYETLNPKTKDDFLKAEYVSLPFFIITLCLVKWSISTFINNLSPGTQHQRMVLALRVAVVLWTVSAILISVFQCAIPSPWNYIEGVRCVDRRAWWTYVSVLNIITEAGIIVLYILIFARLQTSRSRRTKIISIFSTRILVIAAIMAQLILFWKASPNQDITGSQWLPMLCNQLVLCLSVVTACLPYLKPLMESLESGIVRRNIPGSEEGFSQEFTSYQTSC